MITFVVVAIHGLYVHYKLKDPANARKKQQEEEHYGGDG